MTHKIAARTGEPFCQGRSVRIRGSESASALATQAEARAVQVATDARAAQARVALAAASAAATRGSALMSAAALVSPCFRAKSNGVSPHCNKEIWRRSI